MIRKPNFTSKCGVYSISTILFLALFLFSLFTIRIMYVKELRRQLLYDFSDDDLFSYDYGFTINGSNIPFNDIYAMKDKIQFINDNQVIYNQHMFGPVKSSTFIIVIQVHDNLNYLRQMVESLKYVMGITSALLVFSHDFYNTEINNFISNITFTKWTQIFYPYSTQLHPRTFPGPDPYFCIGDFQCQESEFSRVADLAQMKHHWWWQLNFVFDHLRVISDYSNRIIFLEADQYILKDFLYTIRLYEFMLPSTCPDCEIMTFGSRDPSLSQYDTVSSSVILEKWGPNLNNYGLVFNRSVWEDIKNHSRSFCYFDDYRWDQSLRHLGQQRSKGQFMLLSSEGPRVLRIKKEGEDSSSFQQSISEVVKFAWKVRRGLFPRSLAVKNGNNDSKTEVIPGGDWFDVRDRELCLYLTKF